MALSSRGCARCTAARLLQWRSCARAMLLLMVLDSPTACGALMQHVDAPGVPYFLPGLAPQHIRHPAVQCFYLEMSLPVSLPVSLTPCVAHSLCHPSRLYCCCAAFGCLKLCCLIFSNTGCPERQRWWTWRAFWVSRRASSWRHALDGMHACLLSSRATWQAAPHAG